jgi:hypothetical protein
MSDAENVLFKGPIGCQMRGIFSSRDQEDVRCGEYSLQGTNRMSDAENILFKGPIGCQMRRIFSSRDQYDVRCGE